MSHPEHLQMIQAVIERMGRNSFLLKGWTVGLVAALIGLSAEKSNPDLALIAAGAALIFGLLDAYYLAIERKYRLLYEEAISEGEGAPSWSLKAEEVSARDLGRAALSSTVLPLHGSVVTCALIVALT